MKINKSWDMRLPGCCSCQPGMHRLVSILDIAGKIAKDAFRDAFRMAEERTRVCTPSPASLFMILE